MYVIYQKENAHTLYFTGVKEWQEIFGIGIICWGRGRKNAVRLTKREAQEWMRYLEKRGQNPKLLEVE